MSGTSSGWGTCVTVERRAVCITNLYNTYWGWSVITVRSKIRTRNSKLTPLVGTRDGIMCVDNHLRWTCQKNKCFWVFLAIQPEVWHFTKLSLQVEFIIHKMGTFLQNDPCWSDLYLDGYLSNFFSHFMTEENPIHCRLDERKDVNRGRMQVGDHLLTVMVCNSLQHADDVSFRPCGLPSPWTHHDDYL